MKKILSMLTATPKTHDELAFRTQLRLGAFAICALIAFGVFKLVVLIWPVLVLVVVGLIVWAVVKQEK